jgi:GNAT superfamily N-acetyltransferase
MEYHIRPATIDDAPALYGISVRAHTASYYDQLIPDDFKAAFYEHYAISQAKKDAFIVRIRRKIEHADWQLAVAEQDGTVVGYTVAHRIGDMLVLSSLFVDPVRHTKGIGTALFNLSLTWAKPGDKVSLSVIEANTVARSIYEKAGFKIVDTKSKDFYGAKTVTMERLAD